MNRAPSTDQASQAPTPSPVPRPAAQLASPTEAGREPLAPRRVELSRRTVFAGVGLSAASLVAAGPAGRVAAQEPIQLENFDDVVYGTVDGVDLLVNIVRPADRSTPAPAVMVVHGGGLIQGSRWDHGEAAIALAEAGYATFSLEYRLYTADDPTTRWPAQLDDVQRTVRWVRANAETYAIDPERIGAFGFSSGGQLAAFLGTRDTRDNSEPELESFSSRVAAVVTLGGLFDFTFENAHPGAVELDAEILGGAVDDLPPAEAYADFSPILFVDGASAPFLLLQEGNEDVIPYAQPFRMLFQLQGAGVQVTYSYFPETTHDSWFNWAPAAPETLAFFARHLLPES